MNLTHLVGCEKLQIGNSYRAFFDRKNFSGKTLIMNQPLIQIELLIFTLQIMCKKPRSFERLRIDSPHAVRDMHLIQSPASFKQGTLHLTDSVRELHPLQRSAAGKRSLPDCVHLLRKHKLCQLLTILKRGRLNLLQ